MEKTFLVVNKCRKVDLNPIPPGNLFSDRRVRQYGYAQQTAPCSRPHSSYLSEEPPADRYDIDRYLSAVPLVSGYKPSGAEKEKITKSLKN